MNTLIAREYPTQQALDAAYAAITRMMDRTDAHAVLTKIKLTEPHERFVLALACDAGDAEIRRFTPGHWHGGAVVELPREIHDALLAHAQRMEDEHAEEGLREERRYDDRPKHLTVDGDLVDREDV